MKLLSNFLGSRKLQTWVLASFNLLLWQKLMIRMFLSPAHIASLVPAQRMARNIPFRNSLGARTPIQCIANIISLALSLALLYRFNFSRAFNLIITLGIPVAS